MRYVTSDRAAYGLAGTACVAYLALMLDGLAVVPPVTDDEAWIASSAHKLATQGVFGSDLIEGLFGGERHTFHHMPLYGQLLAVVFRICGMSAFTMRLLPLGCGLLVISLVFALGRRLGGPGLGSLAAVLVLGLRVGAGEGRTGIPLLDLARIGRYDIMVPVFGLAALMCFPRTGRPRPWRWLVIGALVGLSSLAHVYGAFLLVALAVVMIWGRRGALRPGLAPLLTGFILVVLPWLWYVASSWSDFEGQLAIPAGRFELWRPSFYATNLIREFKRYCSVELIGCAQPRLGGLLTLVGVPSALVLALRRDESRSDEGVRELAFVLLAQALLFAALLSSKNPSYAIALWPLAMLLLAWLLIRLGSAPQPAWRRWGTATVLVLVIGDGVLGMWKRHAAQAATTPYERFESRLSAAIPRPARVLGLPRFWLGLPGVDYRSWAVPFSLARTAGSGSTLRQSLDAIDPDVVLLDPSMSSALEERASPQHPYHSERLDVDAFLAARSATLATVLEDDTYGPVKVYLLVSSRKSMAPTVSSSAP
jgi:4-amino-4-deoxy-L-arabinose transferase-like glycosyltransferase